MQIIIIGENMSVVGFNEWSSEADRARYPTVRDLFNALSEGDPLVLLENFEGYEGDTAYVFDEHGVAVEGDTSLFVTDAKFDVLPNDKAKAYNAQSFQFYKGMKLIVGLYNNGGVDVNAGVYRVTALESTINALFVAIVAHPTVVNLNNLWYIKVRIDNYMEGGSFLIDCTAGTPGTYNLSQIAANINAALGAISSDLANTCTVYNNSLRLDGVTMDGTGQIVLDGPDINAPYNTHDATNLLFGIQTTTTSTTSLTIGLGSKTLVTADLGMDVSQGREITIKFDNSNYMSGTVTSYDGVTGTLVANITTAVGSGTYDWLIILPYTVKSGIAAILDRELVQAYPWSVVPDGQHCYALYPHLLAITNVAQIRDNLRNTVSLARTKYGGRDFSTLVDEAVSYLKLYYGDRFNNFYASDYGLMLVEAMAFMLDTMSFYLSFKAGENYLDTVVLASNASKIVRQIGYKAKGANAALANANITIQKRVTNPTHPFYLGKGSSFTVGGKTFSLANDVFVDGSSASIPAVCFEGQTRTITQVGSGKANQKINLPVTDGMFLASNVNTGATLLIVLVNGVEYRYTDFFVFDADKQNVFEAEFLTNPPYISFGDGVAGAIPSDGAQIVVEYAVTDGIDGNASVQSEVANFDGMIIKNLSGDVASASYQSLVFADFYMEADNQPVVTMTSVSSGGADPETTAEIQINAPASFSTARRAVTEADYSYFINSYSTSIKGVAVSNRGLTENGEITKLVDDTYGALQANILGIVGLNDSQKKNIIDYMTSSESGLDSSLNGIVSESGKANHISVYIVAVASDGSYFSPSEAVISDLTAFLNTIKMVTTTVTVRDGSQLIISVDALIGINALPYYNTAELQNSAENAVRNLLKKKNFGDDLFHSVCENSVQSIAGVGYCDIELVPYKVLTLDGSGMFNDANNNVVNGNASWSETYTAGTVSGSVVGSGGTTTSFASNLSGYEVNFWVGSTIIFSTGPTGTIAIVEGYDPSNGQFTVSTLSGAPIGGNTFTVTKNYEFLRVSNTSNAGFYQISDVRQIPNDVDKTEVEFGVYGHVIGLGATPQTDFLTDISAVDGFWNGAVLKYKPVLDSPVGRVASGPQYRVVQTYTNFFGEITINSPLAGNSAVSDSVLLSRTALAGKFTGHLFAVLDSTNTQNLECAFGGTIPVSDVLSFVAPSSTVNCTGIATEIKITGSTAPSVWYKAGDCVFVTVSDITNSKYGIYEILKVEVSGADTVITLIDPLPNLTTEALTVKYVRTYNANPYLASALAGFGELDNPNTDEVKGSSNWYSIYKENPPEGVLVPIEGLGAATKITADTTSYVFDGAASWKKFFDDKPASEEWNIKVLVTTGLVPAGMYRIAKDANGVPLVTSYVKSGKTYTRVTVDKYFDDTTILFNGNWVSIGDAIPLFPTTTQYNIPVSFIKIANSYKLYITDGTNVGKYDVLSVTQKEGGTESVIRIMEELVGFDGSGQILNEKFNCCFLVQSDDNKDGMGNILAKNPLDGTAEIISMGDVSSYLITKAA
ncbi:MAG: hypothetical protein HQK96_04065 [Nitrospirae bacterium]|nr:hypothetical protein [Nitrospirota bacterium]